MAETAHNAAPPDRLCWHALTMVSDDPGGCRKAEVRIPSDSLWFHGHFPGEPILPGVALLSMVAEMVASGRREGETPWRPAAYRKVRFRLPVRPGEILHLTARSDLRADNREWSFRIDGGGGVVCSGTVVLTGAETVKAVGRGAGEGHDL